MYEKLPNELKNQNHWVCSWENSKVPINVKTGKGAKPNDPSTWVSYNEAIEKIEDDTYDYLGYMFHDTGIVGIDIDKGLDEDGFLNKETLEIIDRCKSYTELSKSGRGVHIFLKGKLPFKGKNNNGIEIYKDGRYFICTGRNIAYNSIIENQEAIDYILNNCFKESEKLPQNRTKRGSSIYSPTYSLNGSKISLKRHYPEVIEGSRHISMLSLAGTLHSRGYEKIDIYNELSKANKEACKPMLPDKEIVQIVESIVRYKR